MLISLIFFCVHALGLLTAMRAIMEVRTSQGTIAWVVSLVTFPWIALPAYWIFGRSSFSGYVSVRRKDLREGTPRMQQLMRDLDESGLKDALSRSHARLLENLAKTPFTTGNAAELLVNGEATFRAIFSAIATAQEYILVHFFILRDDALGTELQDALIARAKDGVKCYVMYDEIGHRPHKKYIQRFRDADVCIVPFNTRQGRSNRFQINFRNHRKIVVVDGRVAFVGGHNVGDEYLGRMPAMSPWRDTHVAVRGPVVQCVQLAFAEDWYWAKHESLTKLNWKPQRDPDGNAVALCLPTGPADEFETASLYFLHVIHAAEQRVWIASPYFVPDEQLMSALESAALRGVDVRILIPDNPDGLLVGYAVYAYLPTLEKAGVQIKRYLPGFMHQKVMLVDNAIASVGTANCDNRSFRLNFEITMVFSDEAFVRAVENMLQEDMSHCRNFYAKELTNASFFFRLVVRVCRLLAPIL